jgi:uncharacterized protein YxeA
MKQTLIALMILLAAAVYVGRPVKGDDTPKEQTYVRVSYCFDTQSVHEQRQSKKQKIVLGYSLTSLDPNSDEMKACKKVGAPMIGYVQISPPVANPE